MKERYLVKSVFRYDFNDRETGKRIQGVKITCDGQIVRKPDFEGVENIQLTTPNMNMYSEFANKVPGYFDLELLMEPSKKGIRLSLVDATYVGKDSGIKAVS